MNLAQINENPDRMPYVRFERRAVESPAETLKAGHYVAIDVDFALVTPPYSKDVMIHKVTNWLKQLEIDVSNGRMPAEWLESYKKAYSAWQNGQELPVDGTPIRGWGLISPGQQETLIKMHILTVEQLAAITHEGIQRIGMGGQDLKNKAEAWLKTLAKGGGALEMAKLKKDNEALQTNNKILSDKVDELSQALKAFQTATGQEKKPVYELITSNDLLDDDAD